MGSRKPIIAGNWKMNTLRNDAIELAREVRRLTEQVRDTDVVLIPPFVFLSDVEKTLKESRVGLGAQSCEYRESGAFTGEVSTKMLKSVGCSYVLCGHSERRKIYGESEGLINAKLQAALQEGLSPILCIGETLEERQEGKTLDVLTRQLEGGLNQVTKEQMASVVIAYEPVWAIGTGETASPGQAQDTHASIREWLLRTYDSEVASATRIQYGGSVKPGNVDELMKKPDIDGALVGGASLNAESFVRIVKFIR